MRILRLFLPLLLGLFMLIGMVACAQSKPVPFISSLLPTPAPTPTPLPVFSGEAAYEHVLAQTALGPRATGTEAGRRTGDYIIGQLRAAGWQVEIQEFVYNGVPARNIIGKRGRGAVTILGAHYDTRRQADHDPDPAKRTQPVIGANDGASGVAVLLELARTLNVSKTDREIWLTFFDAEDNGQLDNWDWLVGSTHLADNLTVTPTAMILLDMIGDADQNIYQEKNSTPALNDSIWQIAAQLGYSDTIIAQPKWAMIDDHIPFLQRGIPAVDMIDFDYPYWHTTQDTADKVSPQSLERVGRTLQTWLEQKTP